MVRNVLTGKYIRDNRKFADLCNYYLYHGKPIVKPEELVEADVTILGTPFTSKGTQNLEKIRDILKNCAIKSTNGITYLIIGVENQTNIHYAMVIRNMVQDALSYAAQVEETAKKHRLNKDLRDGGEYLSGFSKQDRLTPVITITLYWNSGKWDAPRTLHEMLDVSDQEILQYISDYHLNLVVPDEIDDFGVFETDLGVVLQMLQCAKDKQKMKALLAEKSRLIIEKDTVDLLEECVNLKIDVPQEKGEVVDLCKALQDWAEEERAEGRAEGIEQGIEQGKILMVVSLMKDGYITKEIAANKIGIKANEFENMLASMSMSE